MAWHGAVRCGAVMCGAVQCGAVRRGAVRRDAAQCGAVRRGAARRGAVRCGAVRCGAIGALWCGAVRCGAVRITCCRVKSPTRASRRGYQQQQDGPCTAPRRAANTPRSVGVSLCNLCNAVEDRQGNGTGPRITCVLSCRVTDTRASRRGYQQQQSRSSTAPRRGYSVLCRWSLLRRRGSPPAR